MKRGRARQRAHFKLRTCTGPLSYGGRCAAAFILAARAPSTAARTGQGRPAPGIRGRALALALTRRAVMCYGPSPLRQPTGRARWQGRAHPKAKSVRCPPRAMPGPKAKSRVQGREVPPAVGPEQARAHKRGGLGGCNIADCRQLQPYVLRVGCFRYFGFAD